MQVAERRGRRRKQLLDNLKENRRYCTFKAEALDRDLWRTRCERGCSRAVRKVTESMNERVNEIRVMGCGICGFGASTVSVTKCNFSRTLAGDSSIFETKESACTCNLSGCLCVTWVRVRKERRTRTAGII